MNSKVSKILKLFILTISFFSLLGFAQEPDLVQRSCATNIQNDANVAFQTISMRFDNFAKIVTPIRSDIGSALNEIALRFKKRSGTLEELSALISQLSDQLIAEADSGVDPIFLSNFSILNSRHTFKFSLQVLNGCVGLENFENRRLYLHTQIQKRYPQLAIASQKLKSKIFERARVLLSREEKPVLLGRTAKCAYYDALEGLDASEIAELKEIEKIYEAEFMLEFSTPNMLFNGILKPPPKLCPDEKLTAREYAMLLRHKGSSGDLNNALFTGSPELLEKTDSMIFYLEMALSKFPDFRGNVRRGASKDQAYFDSISPGQDFTEKIFMSTSATPNWLWSGNTLLKIVSLHGKHIVDYGGFQKENEVLIRPSTKFRVLSKAFDPAINRMVIEYQEVRD